MRGRLLLLVLAVFLIPLGWYVLSSWGRVTFTVQGETVTLPRRDLLPFLRLLEKRWKSTPVTLVIDGETVTVSKDILGASFDLKATKRTAEKGELIPRIRWDDQKVTAFLRTIQEETYRPPQDAFWKDNRCFRAQEGRILNIPETLKALEEAFAAWRDEVVVDTFDALPPAKSTEAALKERGMTFRLAFFATSLEGREDDVIFNIAKAASSLSGLFLPRGQTFSFNAVVGKADKEDGYRKTRVLSNGRLVPGYGGGVCQVASTLYNALLRTEAEILERHPHSGYSETTSYVPPGLDAAVSYGSKDLRFRFPSQSVVIFAYIQGRELVCEIWGEKENTVTTTITQRLGKLARVNENEGTLTVETTVKRQGAQSLSFSDTYLIPWEFAQDLVQHFPGT